MTLKKHNRNLVKFIEYGTAGFRDNESLLDHVMYRMGMLAVLRSKQQNSQIIGLMVTASHNPEEDNGIKLIDPHGEMLTSSWESLATKLVNCEDEQVENVLEDIVKEENINNHATGHVFIGMDTRKSSARLCSAAIDGITALNGVVTNYGVVSTPMLHFFVNCQNNNFKYGQPTPQGYFNKLSTAFKNLRKPSADNKNYISHIKFDGANGVGANIMSQFLPYLENYLTVDIYNNGNGILNYKCGSDYVKVNQRAPDNVPPTPNTRCVSVDGDADRIIYFYIDQDNQFCLLDGDRIAILIASYLQELITDARLKINLGLVQTAYANGSSTEYARDKLNIPVVCSSTGVKNLHHEALSFDIGVYFEANGHGTVLYKEELEERVKDVARRFGPEQGEGAAARKLLEFINLTNQTVGDALSDLLLVETVLHARGWDASQWFNMYHSLPNRLSRVSVKDRNVIQTTDSARRCVKPDGLQTRIDDLVKQYSKGRSFVRSSGTEDVVRIYAEASTQTEADELASKVAQCVFELCGGV